jgi:hypothetical protein
MIFSHGNAILSVGQETTIVLRYRSLPAIAWLSGRRLPHPGVGAAPNRRLRPFTFILEDKKKLSFIALEVRSKNGEVKDFLGNAGLVEFESRLCVLSPFADTARQKYLEAALIKERVPYSKWTRATLRSPAHRTAYADTPWR